MTNDEWEEGSRHSAFGIRHSALAASPVPRPSSRSWYSMTALKILCLQCSDQVWAAISSSTSVGFGPRPWLWRSDWRVGLAKYSRIARISSSVSERMPAALISIDSASGTARSVLADAVCSAGFSPFSVRSAGFSPFPLETA